MNLFEIQKQLRITMREITEVLSDERPHLTLSKQGWYLDLKIPHLLPFDLQKLIELERSEEVDLILIETYKENFNTIIEQLKTKYPKRKVVAEELEKAYLNKLYHIAIPSCIILADSICLDAIKIKFFDKNKNDAFQLSVNKILKDYEHPLIDVLTLSLKQNAPIYSQEKSLGDFKPNSLNRHQILHGSASGYGSEMNFLKSISLISLLMDLIDRIPEQKNS